MKHPLLARDKSLNYAMRFVSRQGHTLLPGQQLMLARACSLNGLGLPRGMMARLAKETQQGR